MPGTVKGFEGKIIQPGPSLVEAGRALEDPRRQVGKWPYQWLFPGPNSRQVLANGTSVAPTSGTPQTPLSYTVPDGYRFSLRAIVFFYNGTLWHEGTATGLSFSLIDQAAGSRAVDFLANVLTHLGTPDQPYPILGRLEFAPTDVLTVVVSNGGGFVPAGTDTVVAHLVGHTYPNSEVVG